MRPVANLLQLCGGSRRPWLWVGGYDRTAWVLTMMLARLSCVRPKAVSGRGVKHGRMQVSDLLPYRGLARLTQRLTPQAIIRQDAAASSGASSAVAELGGGLREVDVARHDEDISPELIATIESVHLVCIDTHVALDLRAPHRRGRAGRSAESDERGGLAVMSATRGRWLLMGGGS